MKNGQIIYQANKYAVWLGPILKSFMRGKRRLETYDSLFSKDGEIGTGDQYQRLYMVDEHPDVLWEDLLGLQLKKEIKFCINLVPRDVLWEDLLGLQLNKEIEFCINLVPRAQLLFITQYQMELIELIELRKYLDELLEKNLIRSNSSPWLQFCLPRKQMIPWGFALTIEN